MGQAAAAHGIAGLDVIEMDVEAPVEVVMQYGLCRFASATQPGGEQLRTVMVLHRRGERATVRLADGREQDVHTSSLVSMAPRAPSVDAWEIEQARQEIPGIDPIQARNRAIGRRIAEQQIAAQRAAAVRGLAEQFAGRMVA